MEIKDFLLSQLFLKM